MGQYSISNGHDAEHVGLKLTDYSLDTGKKRTSLLGDPAGITSYIPSLLQYHLNAGAGVVHQNVDATPDLDGLCDLGVNDILRVGDVELHEMEPGRVRERAEVLNLLEYSGGGDDLVVSVEGGLDQSPAHAGGGTGDEPHPGAGVVGKVLGDGHW